mmetsp:Transcript_17867/g.46812  ORF Transcript_17867/g.46812 Transcript_17867/m.46812 type:complete len:215 (-) Transcript_17867:136-780(-)
MVELLIGAGASINWSPPVAVASAPTGPKPKFGTTPLLNAIDMCDQYRGTDQVVGLTVLQALLIAGADLSQGGWRSRGSMYSHIGSLHLVWYTPRSWFELLAGTEGEIGIEAADLIEELFRRHATHRAALRILGNTELPAGFVSEAVHVYAGLPERGDYYYDDQFGTPAQTGTSRPGPRRQAQQQSDELRMSSTVSEMEAIRRMFEPRHHKEVRE